MQLWKEIGLEAYYLASIPLRRQAAARRAALACEPVQVLFYHRVADSHPNDWTMSCKRFAQQIAWLKARFDIVSLAEAQLRLQSGKNDRPTACITFDDGYADNCDFAIPLLIRQRVPFTYFVASAHVIEQRPFAHDVARDQPLLPNTSEQIRVLAQTGVEIGAHTRNHADLGASSDPRFLHEEIVGSKVDLENLTGGPVRYFAFPFGQHRQLTPAAFDVARDAGFAGVCSAYGGYNWPGDDPFHIQRIHADPEMIRLKNWMTIDPRKDARASGRAWRP
ncbi:MAG: polysaccharide deacetylase family protein [Pirellulales bacterium]